MYSLRLSGSLALGIHGTAQRKGKWGFACSCVSGSHVAFLTVTIPVFSALNWPQNSSCGLRCSLGVLLNTKLCVATKNCSWIGICLEMIFYFFCPRILEKKKKWLNMDCTHGILNYELPPPSSPSPVAEDGKADGLRREAYCRNRSIGWVSPVLFWGGEPTQRWQRK